MIVERQAKRNALVPSGFQERLDLLIPVSYRVNSQAVA